MSHFSQHPLLWIAAIKCAYGYPQTLRRSRGTSLETSRIRGKMIDERFALLAFALLLASAGREPSNVPAVRDDAGPGRVATDIDGIGESWMREIALEATEKKMGSWNRQNVIFCGAYGGQNGNPWFDPVGGSFHGSS